MKSLRVKAWFKATPSHVLLDGKRASQLGTENLVKLMTVARKHKTKIKIQTQHPEGMLNLNKIGEK